MKRAKSTVYCLSLFFGLLAACLLLAACSEPGYGGAETITVNISLGSTGSSRVFAEDVGRLTLADISHKVTLTSGNQEIPANVTEVDGQLRATATVTTGLTWRIDVEARRKSDNSIYAIGDDTRYIDSSTGNINITMSRAVIFNPNGGSGRIDPIRGDHNQEIKLPYGAGFTNPGHAFAGWNTAPDGGTGKYYKAGETTQLTNSVEFYAVWLPSPLANPTHIESYLANADPEVGTLSSPLPLPVGMELSSDNWTEMFEIISENEKYVNLDLSSSSSSTSSAGGSFVGVVFDPRVGDPPSNPHGSEKIVELILPNGATRIEGAPSGIIFGGFSNLRSVSGSSVTEIGQNAFNGISSLTSVEFPKLVTIVNDGPSDSVFRGTGLTSIDFQELTSIGISAFGDCENLASVNIPNVGTIEDNAFAGCLSLTSITISSDCTIGDHYTGIIGRFTSFMDYYEENDKANGTYTWNNDTERWEGPN